MGIVSGAFDILSLLWRKRELLDFYIIERRVAASTESKILHKGSCTALVVTHEAVITKTPTLNRLSFPAEALCGRSLVGFPGFEKFEQLRSNIMPVLT